MRVQVQKRRRSGLYAEYFAPVLSENQTSETVRYLVWVILDVILEGNWTNCKEIFYEARKRDPKLGMATVYRTVSTLEEIGVLTRSYQYSFVSDKDCLRKGCDVR